MSRFISLTAAALMSSVALFAGDALAEDQQRLPARGPAIGNVTRLAIPTWKTVTVGDTKGVDGYRRALESAAIAIGDAANEILGRPAFPYLSTRASIELVVAALNELSLDQTPATLSEVYQRAIRLGLGLCPAEAGLQLRLDYRNQPLGEFLHVAMEPVKTYGGRPTILTLANTGAGLALIGSDGRPDFVVPARFRFVFARPTPVSQALEAKALEAP